MTDEARWNYFLWLQGKIETLIRDTCGIRTALLRVTYILITDVFHASLTIDLRLKNPHSKHVLQQELLECLHEQRKWYLAILSRGLTPVEYIDSPELPVTRTGTWTEASCFHSGGCLWQHLSSHGVALLAPVGPCATEHWAAYQSLLCPPPKAVSETCWLCRCSPRSCRKGDNTVWKKQGIVGTKKQLRKPIVLGTKGVSVHVSELSWQ